MYINYEELKAKAKAVDLLSLVDTRLKKESSSNGGEYSGSCPFCGGRDRFRVQPERGLWWCRQCGGEHWQDAIAFVQRRDNTDFKTALHTLANTPLPTRLLRPRNDLEKREGQSKEWSEKAALVVEICEKALWSKSGERALQYLHNRGLTDDTIKAARLGFNAEARRINDMYVSRGIVIPWFYCGDVVKIQVRGNGTDGKRYKAVSGSRNVSLYGIDAVIGFDKPIFLVEGELDCMLVAQECDIYAVATGGSIFDIDEMTKALLKKSELWLAFDSDEAGEEYGNRYGKMFDIAGKIVIAGGNDIGDLHACNVNISEYIGLQISGVSDLDKLEQSIGKCFECEEDLEGDCAPWEGLSDHLQSLVWEGIR